MQKKHPGYIIIARCTFYNSRDRFHVHNAAGEWQIFETKKQAMLEVQALQGSIYYQSYNEYGSPLYRVHRADRAPRTAQ